MVTERLTLSITETAAVLGLSRPSVYRLIHRGDFPAFSVGGRTLVSRELLADWVRRQAESGGNET